LRASTQREDILIAKTVNARNSGQEVIDLFGHTARLI
jgi:hypothetical protein